MRINEWIADMRRQRDLLDNVIASFERMAVAFGDLRAVLEIVNAVGRANPAFTPYELPPVVEGVR